MQNDPKGNSDKKGPTDVPPNRPQNLRAAQKEPKIPGDRLLTWEAPSGTVSKYKVQSRMWVNGQPERPWGGGYESATETKYLLTSLQPGCTYQFRVLATNDLGDSGPSDPVTVTPKSVKRKQLSKSKQKSDEKAMARADEGESRKDVEGAIGFEFADTLRPYMDSAGPNCDVMDMVARGIVGWLDIYWADVTPPNETVSNLRQHCDDAIRHRPVTYEEWSRLAIALVDDTTTLLRFKDCPGPGAAISDGLEPVHLLQMRSLSSDGIIGAGQGIYRWLDGSPNDFITADGVKEIVEPLRDACRTIFLRVRPIVWVDIARGLEIDMIKLLSKRPDYS